MIAIPAGDPAGVDRMYAKAIELGATDEGAPGPRNPVFYGAYVRDADGNFVNTYTISVDPLPDSLDDLALAIDAADGIVG